MGSGLPVPGGHSAELSPSEPAKQDLSPENPVPVKVMQELILESGRSRAGRCQHSLTGKLILSFPSPEVGGEEPGRRVPLIFFA